MINDMIDIAFPIVRTKVHINDKPYITSEIKKMNRKRKKEFRRRGKSRKYREIDREYQRKIKEEAKKYVEKKVTLVKKSNPRQAASILKELSRDPSEGDTNVITLTSHLEEGLPEDEQRRRILRY